jgi:hypothetical protein
MTCGWAWLWRGLGWRCSSLVAWQGRTDRCTLTTNHNPPPPPPLQNNRRSGPRFTGTRSRESTHPAPRVSRSRRRTPSSPCLTCGASPRPGRGSGTWCWSMRSASTSRVRLGAGCMSDCLHAGDPVCMELNLLAWPTCRTHCAWQRAAHPPPPTPACNPPPDRARRPWRGPGRGGLHLHPLHSPGGLPVRPGAKLAGAGAARARGAVGGAAAAQLDERQLQVCARVCGGGEAVRCLAWCMHLVVV